MTVRVARLLLATIVVSAGLVIGVDAMVVSDPTPSTERGTIERRSLDGVTMVSSQSEGLFFLSERGDVIARLTREDTYLDADRIPEAGDRTVLYTAANYRPADRCGFPTECIENRVVRYNLSTGERRVLFNMTTKRYDDEQWHDADYLGPERVVVADLARDRVFVANTSTGLVTWEWQAHQAYNASSDGRPAQDWTHINDVEVLPDGRLMISVRNHDQVIFVDPETGIEESWTLGQDHDPEAANKTLYEQHNPDYIPRRHGGPSVLAADSEHNRVVEFQRRGTNWTRTWEYSAGLNWPRDADRLPNGNTLITDSRDNEVVEINRAGDVVWRRSVPLPYEAERFGSGPESAGGPSATSAGLDSVSGSSGQATPFVAAKRYLPDRVVNAVSFVLARYPISLASVVAAVFALVAAAVWAVLEWRWSSYRLRVPVTKE